MSGQTVQDVLAGIDALGKRCRILYGIYVGLYAVAFLLVVLRYQAGLIVALVNVAFYLLVIRRAMKRYSSWVGRVAVESSVWGGVEEPRWLAPLSKEEFQALEFLPQPTGSLLCRHRWGGAHRSVQLTCGEITYHYLISQPQGKRGVRFLSGTLLTAQPAWEGEDEWLLLKKELLTPEAAAQLTTARGYEPEPLPEKDWARGYELWRRGSRRELPGALWKAVERLPALGALRISQAGVSAFLHNRFYAPGKITPRTVPTEQSLRVNALPELKPFLELMDGLENIQTRKC